MKLLNLLKTALQPPHSEQLKTRSCNALSPEGEVRTSERRYRATKLQPAAQTRRQSEALRNLLRRADAIGSSR
jgi:hypothetical protein